jgi:hypothetical protein
MRISRARGSGVIGKKITEGFCPREVGSWVCSRSLLVVVPQVKIGHEYLRISIPANSPAKPQSQEHFFVLKVLAHESLLEPEKPKRSGLEDFSSFVSVSVNWRVAFFRI